MLRNKQILLLVTTLLILSMLAGCASPAAPAVETPTNAIDTDVLVIGGGAAGLAAAIEAAEEGVSVMLIEKLPMLGGSTLLSGGIMYGAQTPTQKRAGVEEKWEDLAAYWIEMANGNVDKDIINYIAEHSGETFEWLESQGVEFSEKLSAQGISPALRGHTTKEGRGFGFIKPLTTVAEENGVEILLNTAATKLIVSDGVVVGAEAEGKDGKFTINAKSVVIATGGYDKNPEVVAEYSPVAKGQISYVAAGNKGDGLLMAKEVGADIVSNNGVIGFRGVAEKYPYTTPLGGLVFYPNLFVDQKGERFMNELNHYAIMYDDMMKTGSTEFYSIFDKNSPAVETLETGIEEGYVFKGESFEELAKEIGIPAEAFAASVKRYNDLAIKGVDEDFGKAAIAPIEEGLVYALKVSPATLGTFGGPRINLQGEVLNKEGQAIKGLYAAGEVANGQLFDTIYPASGSSITMSFTLGRIAGSEAAKSTK